MDFSAFESTAIMQFNSRPIGWQRSEGRKRPGAGGQRPTLLLEGGHQEYDGDGEGVVIEEVRGSERWTVSCLAYLSAYVGQEGIVSTFKY